MCGWRQPWKQPRAERHAAHEAAQQDAYRDRRRAHDELHEMKPDHLVDQGRTAAGGEEKLQHRVRCYREWPASTLSSPDSAAWEVRLPRTSPRAASACLGSNNFNR